MLNYNYTAYCIDKCFRIRVWILVFIPTSSNISAISWRPVLAMEEAAVPGENHRPWAS
jgi:hypothetical protein